MKTTKSPLQRSFRFLFNYSSENGKKPPPMLFLASFMLFSRLVLMKIDKQIVVDYANTNFISTPSSSSTTSSFFMVLEARSRHCSHTLFEILFYDYLCGWMEGRGISISSVRRKLYEGGWKLKTERDRTIKQQRQKHNTFPGCHYLLLFLGSLCSVRSSSQIFPGKLYFPTLFYSKQILWKWNWCICPCARPCWLFVIINLRTRIHPQGQITNLSSFFWEIYWKKRFT